MAVPDWLFPLGSNLDYGHKFIEAMKEIQTNPLLKVAVPSTQDHPSGISAFSTKCLCALLEAGIKEKDLQQFVVDNTP